MFINVILPLALDKTFTYAVNEEEYKFILPGMRVAVPFGKSKVYTALVVEKHQIPPQLYEPKDIQQIIDDAPIVTLVQLEHWKWIAAYYMCSIGEVYKSALPSALILESETILTAEKKTFEQQEVTDEEYLVLEALQHQSSITIAEVAKILNGKKVIPVVQSLLQKGLLLMNEEVQEQYKPKMVKYIKLHDEFLQANQLQELLQVLGKAEKQKELVMHYFQLFAKERKPVLSKLLLESSGISSTVLKNLVEKGIFVEYFLNQDRVIFSNEEAYTIHLSQAQDVALKNIQKSFKSQDVTLFHGVTASGKTEVYIKLIEAYLSNDLQVLFLLPEIALTTQLVQRLTSYFGNQVAVFHSKYNSHERVEVWQHVLQQSDKAKVVIGVRSALFLPFSKLGLIIVDEEHEATYKQQDPAPRFHARDAAVVLAKMHKAKVLLGSATPSIESYFNAKASKYRLVELNERFNNVVLPEIHLIDLKDKYFRKRMDGHFSDELIERMQETLANGEQIMLFQNRRGYSPYIECITCGHVPQCPNCDVSLTYYKFRDALKCHYCGYHIAKPTHCHQCHSLDLSTKGFGTEQIELELKKMFPTKRIARMDQDTTRGKFAFEKLIDAVKNQEIDILIGTQMLAKGLDFENVTLVGILNADNLLNQPYYRAYERAFQMMVQVAGRSGRKQKKGSVVIQTYNPLHNTIQQVVNHNYVAMFNEQLYERSNFKYPPYYRLIQIKLRNKDYEKLKDGSTWLYNVLVQHLAVPILGPEEPVVNRIRNEYIKTILIKIPNNTNLINTKKLITKVLVSFDAVPQYRAIKLTLNVDY